MEKRYEIGEKSYVQRPIVLGQLELIEPKISGVNLESLSASMLLGLLGGTLPTVLAIVLLPDGVAVQAACEETALAERAEALKWSLEPEMSLEVIEDFFECNLTSSLSGKIEKMVGELQEHLKKAPGWKTSFTGSAPAISPGEKALSGESKPGTPIAGLNPKTEKTGTSSPGS